MNSNHLKVDISVLTICDRYRHDLSKAIITVITVLVGCGVVMAQKKEIQTSVEISQTPDISGQGIEVSVNADLNGESKNNKISRSISLDKNYFQKTVPESSGNKEALKPFDRNFFLKPEFKTAENARYDPKDTYPADQDEKPIQDLADDDDVDRFHWKPALAESMYFLGIQHAFRMVQTKTRRELKGPFFADWGMSVENLGRWRDGDRAATNYFAHPLQGAVTGRIFVNNSDKAKRQQFGRSKDYWESRFKAMLWSTVWSTQFELGPLSEASIGNVGLYDREGPNLMGWVDLVITPTAGTGVMIGEDIIDKYILRKWLERKIKSKTRIRIYRTFFTPVQSFTNVLGGKVPWKRDNR